MKWFKKFVDIIYESWKEVKIIKKASLKEASNQETGDKGEDLVLEKVQASGYHAVFAPFSKTPGDIWGIKKIKNSYEFIHIMLVQVKSTGSGTPSDVSPEEQSKFKVIAKLIREEWDKRIQKEFPGVPLIISYGYAGVENCDDDPRIKNSRYIEMDIPTGYTDINFRNYVRKNVEPKHRFKG